VVSSTDPASSAVNPINNAWTTDFNSFMAYAHSFSSGAVTSAIPLITVNYGTGTPSEAASWVYYANKQMGYGIKYWQVGNEQDGIWEVRGPHQREGLRLPFHRILQRHDGRRPHHCCHGPGCRRALRQFQCLRRQPLHSRPSCWNYKPWAPLPTWVPWITTGIPTIVAPRPR
jgi:hypothetical protein